MSIRLDVPTHLRTGFEDLARHLCGFRGHLAPVAASFGLDPDEADLAACGAIERYLVFAVREAAKGEHLPFRNPDQYRPLLIRMTRDAARDILRARKAAVRNRVPFERGADEAHLEFSAEASDPFRLALAAWCVSRMPVFWSALERTGNLLRPVRQMRAAARNAGCATSAEEFEFLKRFLFHGRTEPGDPSNSEISRRTGWAGTRTGNSCYVAVSRLRNRLRTAWTDAERLAFFEPGDCRLESCTDLAL